MDELANLFKYHPPSDEQIPKYEAIRAAAFEFAKALVTNCPPSADRTFALRQVRSAMMTANASIALDGKNFS